MTDDNARADRLADFVEAAFRDRLTRWNYDGTEARVSCPGPLHEHGDRNPSATVRLSDDGRKVLYHCHVGCETADVMAALGLRMRDLFLDHDGNWSRPEGTATLADVERSYIAYQGEDNLPVFRAVLATVASHRLPDEALWLAILGAPGSGKTETTHAITGLPHVHSVSTVTPAALLSASSRKERAKDATGGLLREVGLSGVALFKDFTSVLSQHRDARAEALAALREVYDGEWVRHVGIDGGRTLAWRGKLTAILCCTEALDSAHAVTAAMGERFLTIRTGVHADHEQRFTGAGRAMRNAGNAGNLRRALARAVERFLTGEQLREAAGHPVTEEVEERLAALASLVASARSAVTRDYRGEIDTVPTPEFPTRLALQLSKLWRSCGLIGMDAEQSWSLVKQVAYDSIPPLRWRVLANLLARQEPALTSDVVNALDRPKRTVWRALEDLHGVGVVLRHGTEQREAATWEVQPWARRCRDQAQPVPVLSSYTCRGEIERSTCSDTSGTASAQARRRRSEPEPLTLTTVTGCSVEEWLAGAEHGFPDGMTLAQLDRLADYCDECLTATEPERPCRPQTLVEDGMSTTAYYRCREGHAWVSTFAGLDVIWEDAA